MKRFLKILENYPRFFLLLVLCLNVGLITRVQAQVPRSPSESNLYTEVDLTKIYDCPNGDGEFHVATGTLPNVLLAGAIGGLLVSSYKDPAWEIYCNGNPAVSVYDPVNQRALAEAGLTNKFSLLSGISDVTAMILQQRPASGINFIEEKTYALLNAGTVTAQDGTGDPSLYNPGGTGWDLLRPIQAFWGWSVNIVYGVLILFIIAIAFAIMFRQKLGGSAVVTIQNAIPSIAMAMVLVPLSYAISGLFIDVITIGANAVHAFLLGPGAPGNTVYENRGGECTGGETGDDQCDRGYHIDDWRVDVLNIAGRLSIREPVESVIETADTGKWVDSFFVFNVVSTILNIFSPNDRNTTAWVGEIVNFVIALLMIWVGLKIGWKLFRKYLDLILMPIISPFIFAQVAIPGNGLKSVQTYAKTLGAASLSFIVAYACFLLTLVFTSASFQENIPSINSGLFIPPLLGLRNFFETISGAGDVSLVGLMFTLIGLGIYFSIPKFLEAVDKALDVKNTFPEFIKTPIESLRESWKITTKAAPALAAKAGQITLGGARNTAAGLTNASFNIRKGYENIIGRSASNPESVVFKRKQENIKARQDLLGELDSVEDKLGDRVKKGLPPDLGLLAERASIQGRLSNLDRLESLQGKEFSSRGEEGKDRTLKIDIKYANGSMNYRFTTVKIQEIYEKAVKGGGVFSEGIGLMDIEAQNIAFTTREDVIFGDTIEYRGLDAYNTDHFFGGSTTAWTPGDSPVFGKRINGTVHDYLEKIDGSQSVTGDDCVLKLRVGGDPKEKNKIKFKEGVSASLPIALIVPKLSIDQFKLFFGEFNPSLSRYVGGILASTLQTQKFAVKVKNVKSIGKRIALSKD